jgi:hypothetical protein
MPDGRIQKVAVQIGGWFNSVDNPALFSVSGSLANGVTTTFRSNPVTVGEKATVVQCENDAGVGAAVNRTITILPSPFESIVPGQTVVKASHILSIRTAVDNVRGYYGLPVFQWASPIIAHRTQIRDWPLHIKEIRTALNAVIALINAHDTASTFDIPTPMWLSLGNERPRADVMLQIQSLILNL